MSTTNSVANGARLDDCHSSIFSLADLTGLRWKKFSATLAIPASPSDDPILEAFSRCLSQDILAVWRRAPNLKKPQTQFQEDELNTSATWELKKELWIFWWGNEPSVEDIGHINGITVEPEGSWEEQGLSYECRTLLFKAIHNLVERCLLADNFVRLGKWFLRPYSKEKDNNKSERLSCCFTFFLRGEVTVCTTVEVAQHHLVETMNETHLQHASNTNSPTDVILSPYALRASLTGVASRSQHEPRARKVLEEWKHFYPLHLKESIDCDETGIVEDSPVPPVVEVIVAGVHMDYPSAYVLLPVYQETAGVEHMDVKSSQKKDFHYLNAPASVGSLLGSINSSISEMGSGAYESTAEDIQCFSNKKSEISHVIKKTSAMAKNILTGILDHCQSIIPPTQAHKETNPNNENPASFFENITSSNHPSYWSCLISPLKKVRQKLNLEPLKEDDDDVYLARQKYATESMLHSEARWKVDKHTHTASKAFHHENMKKSLTSSSAPHLLNLCFPPVQNESRFTTLGASPIDCSGMASYGLQEMPSDLPSETCETLFQADLNNLPPSHSNIVPPQFAATNLQVNKNNLLSLKPSNYRDSKAMATHQEIHEHISHWKRLKLPPRKDKKSQDALVTNPSITPDNLDSQYVITTSGRFKHVRNSIKETQIDWSCSAINSKRRKFEDDICLNENLDSGLAQPSCGNYLPAKAQVVTQHVTVGSVTGELAGMSVPSDPYDFEEDEKDNRSSATLNNSYTADINLKVAGLWSNEYVSGTNKKDLKSPDTGPTDNIIDGSSLLPEYPNAFPCSDSPLVQGSASSKQIVHSLTDKKDLKVSPFDLEHIFNESEDDDTGILTPPDDQYEDIGVHDAKLQQGSDNFQCTKYDLHMFPTPPSLESIQPSSPEQKISSISKLMSGHTTMESTKSQNLGSVNDCCVGVDRSSQDSKIPCLVEDLSSSQDETTHTHGLVINYGSTHFKVFDKTVPSTQPLPNKYLPMSDLPSLTQPVVNEVDLRDQFLYTPSWQVHETFLQQPMDIPTLEMEDDMNYRPMSSISVQSNLTTDPIPLTPSYSVSALTPASVQSPANLPTATPKTPQNSTDNLSSPAITTPTPITLGRMPHMPSLLSMTSSAAASDAGVCRASAIYINLMLSDSVLNLFRDISFDQCPLCVCNDNINSRDVDLGYLPTIAENLSEGQYPCSCGFSAVRNRCLSLNAGLFLEDELEIVGKELENEIIKLKQINFSSLDENIHAIVEYSINQSTNPYLKLSSMKSHHMDVELVNIACHLDIMEACVEAINGGISVMDIGNQPKISVHDCRNILHPWETSGEYISLNSCDIYPLLQFLKPLLQNAIQRLRSERSFNYIQRVNGPLTWREFCKDNSYALEPLPVPLLLVGQNHEWMTISPFALNYWEKLYLEPFTGSTNISFITLCPDVEHIVKTTRLFFQELSSMYEQCRLGMHRAFLRNSKDGGILCVGKDVSSSTEVPDWYKTFLERIRNTQGNEGSSIPPQQNVNTILESVKNYADACSRALDPIFNTSDQQLSRKQAPQSSSQNVIASGVELGKQGSLRPPTPIPAQHQIFSKSGKESYFQAPFPGKAGLNDSGTVVIYIVNPFSVEHDSAFTLVIWKCFMSMIKSLPESLRKSVVIQLVPLRDILQFVGSDNESDVRTVRSLAFSTHAQCRRIVSHMQVRTMTPFGPAASKKKAVEQKVETFTSSTIHSPAFVLANLKTKKRDFISPELDHRREECNILYVTYCLSHDQKWILGSATDQDGAMLETFCVNIEVPPRRVSVSRKQRVRVKCAALQKLWNLCLGAITRTATTHWRIVIGRLGRLSHGEIQEWSKHLNRKNICDLSKQLSVKCKQCRLNGFSRHPNIISASLTSLEPEGSFTIFPDLVKLAPFGRNTSGGTQLQLKTPEDASCTHIYVFPTSSFVQTAGGTFQAENIDFLPGELNLPDFVEQDDLTIIEAVNDYLFEPTTSPVSHQPSTDDSMGQVKTSVTDRLISNDGGNEETSLLQQPLALGYLVSTAPTGPLPDSFWVSCPHAKFRCPIFLRFALHIQVSRDEVQTPGVNEYTDDHYQLDSHKTAQVLRYIMENYNALSWLTCDPVTRDRRSCLPVHYFVLMKLYNMIKQLT